MSVPTVLLVAISFAAWKAPRWVREIGAFALAFGFLSLILGLRQMFSVLQQVSIDIDPVTGIVDLVSPPRALRRLQGQHGAPHLRHHHLSCILGSQNHPVIETLTPPQGYGTLAEATRALCGSFRCPGRRARLRRECTRRSCRRNTAAIGNWPRRESCRRAMRHSRRAGPQARSK